MPYGAPRQQTLRGGHRPQPQPRHRAPGGGAPSPRILIAGVLVLATLAGGYWFLLRGDGGGSSDAFLQAEQRITAAARTVPENAATVQRYLELPAFYDAVNEQLAVVKAETQKLRKVAQDSDGDAATIANNSVNAATRIATSTVSYRDAITESGDLADANAALLDIKASIVKLEQQARAWKRL